jgi:hypothetical protein
MGVTALSPDTTTNGAPELPPTSGVSTDKMAPFRTALAVLCLAASACTLPGQDAPGVFSDLIACLPPQSASAASLPGLVDLADIVALANVTKVETINNGHDGAARVTLKVVDTAKGSSGAEFSVYDAPCPLLGAKTGESFVLFLAGPPLPDGTREVIRMPAGVVRATPARPLAQVMADVRAIRPIDGEARALFERYGWSVTGKHTVDELVMPAATEFGTAGRQLRTYGTQLVESFERYSALSATVGLDPRPFAGKPAEVLTFFLEGARGEFAAGAKLGHALIAERQVVGAWVTVLPESGTFSVRDRATVLAAPVRTPGPFNPPANRVPLGVNIARTYDLASARSISFKSGGGVNGEIADPARIRAFADALDEMLPTVQATFDQRQPPTKYWLHVDFQTRYLSLEYDAQSGLITVLLDGFSAKAPARFAAFVASLP